MNQTVKICSGTLIDESLILTTRHCLVGIKDNILESYELSVQLGGENGNSKYAHEVSFYDFKHLISLTEGKKNELFM